MQTPLATWTSKSAQNNGPKSQSREYSQYRVHYFGHFCGPGTITKWLCVCEARLQQGTKFKALSAHSRVEFHQQCGCWTRSPENNLHSLHSVLKLNAGELFKKLSGSSNSWALGIPPECRILICLLGLWGPPCVHDPSSIVSAAPPALLEACAYAHRRQLCAFFHVKVHGCMLPEPAR